MPGWESGATDVGDCPGSGWGDRKTAAENCGMDRQTLRDWAHRYNAEGVSGLFNRRPPDPPCLLSAAQKEELAEMVRAGPDPETDGVVRWRRIDLKRKIEERFGGCWQTIGKPGLSASVGRPQHPKSDPDAQETSPQR